MVKDFLQTLRECNNNFQAKKPDQERRALDILAKASKDILKIKFDITKRKSLHKGAPLLMPQLKSDTLFIK